MPLHCHTFRVQRYRYLIPHSSSVSSSYVRWRRRISSAFAPPCSIGSRTNRETVYLLILSAFIFVSIILYYSIVNYVINCNLNVNWNELRACTKNVKCTSDMDDSDLTSGAESESRSTNDFSKEKECVPFLCKSLISQILDQSKCCRQKCVMHEIFLP